MKVCPFCAEQIQDAAIVCKHCGRDLRMPPQAPHVQTQVIVQQTTTQPSAGVAAVLSLVIPGAGQLYRGRVLSGLVWFVFVIAGYAMFIVPGLILHLICIIAAASGPVPQPQVVLSTATTTGSTAPSAATTSPPVGQVPQSSNTLAKAIGRAVAILVHPVATIRSDRTTAKVFLVFAYAVLVLYVAAFVVSRVDSPSRTTTTASPVPLKRVFTPTEPDEPCKVEAPPSGQAAAQNWCEGGVFTLVHVSNDASNFVVLLQFSKKGLSSWTNNRYAVLNRFRRIIDEMVEKTDLNVAFSLHDPNGQMVGGCVRTHSARQSTCQ